MRRPLALLKQRNLIWNLPRKNDIYKASYAGELREKFDLTYPDRPDYDAKPKVLRVHVQAQISHSDPGSLPVRADKAARIIGHDILNSLAFEKKRPCEYRDTSMLTDADAARIYELACRENFKLDLGMPAEHTPQSIGLRERNGHPFFGPSKTGVREELHNFHLLPSAY